MPRFCSRADKVLETLHQTLAMIQFDSNGATQTANQNCLHAMQPIEAYVKDKHPHMLAKAKAKNAAIAVPQPGDAYKGVSLAASKVRWFASKACLLALGMKAVVSEKPSVGTKPASGVEAMKSVQ